MSLQLDTCKHDWDIMSHKEVRKFVPFHAGYDEYVHLEFFCKKCHVTLVDEYEKKYEKEYFEKNYPDGYPK